LEFNSVRGQEALGAGAPEIAGRWQWAIARAVGAARAAATRPLAVTGALLTINLLLIGCFVLAGEIAFADPAEMFRELMPGTWLSVAQLAAVAAIAWAIHRELIGPGLRLDNFWGISVVVFAAFVIDEATQLTIFLGDALAAAGALAPAGFRDLDAFLLTVMLLAAGAALLRYGRTLLSHPGGLVLLAIGVVLGAASQTLDAVLASTTGEFVAEESLKLTAEPFLIGGYLLALQRAIGKRRAGPSGENAAPGV
jgi:hypothetical protein